MKTFIFFFLFSLFFSKIGYSKDLKLDQCFGENYFALQAFDKKITKWKEEYFSASSLQFYDTKLNEVFYAAGSDIEQDERYKLFHSINENAFYIKAEDGLITHSLVYSDFSYNFSKQKYEKKYNKPYSGEKYKLTNYKIINYTNDRIFAKKTNVFENILILSETNIVINLKSNIVDFERKNFNRNQKVESIKTFKVFCRPFNYEKVSNKGFFKDLLGNILGK